ncbi:hypothetical protein TNCV_2575601 [Trichonephila clavipes]|uniref:Uncharacterized protein n=1 Tax=Trichonephila clavipes TaxID=2585209 RepID=A0A8X6R5M4_TRICX|nr:hypothetical protein TNCV_2575601 [Trichonephila clavipes]
MALSDSLPQIILGVQGGTQGGSNSLVVRASDSRREGRFDARWPQIPSEYRRSTCSLNQWVRKTCGLNPKCRGLENISLPSSPMAKLWRWRQVMLPSTELTHTVTCWVLKAKANDMRTSSPLPR